ncbi:hypothetical protein [Virgibacillus sp. DJP39]|uniref:hypothetical protein n=1 Tax=Virgibacillus sp. DJP39 TaxID=3409790 RepID=UPI003BB4A4B9
MKKKYLWGMGIILVLLVGFFVWKLTLAETTNPMLASKNVDLTGNSYEELATSMDLPSDKVWKINYPDKIDTSSVTSDNVYVLNSTGEKEQVGLDADGEILLIHPPKQSYKEGDLYTLYIEKELTLVEGSDKHNSIKMDFIIQRQKVNKVKVNKDLVTIQKDSVKEISTTQLILKKDESSNKIKKGQILIVPHEDSEGLAHKVTEVKEEREELIITTEPPAFMEIIPEMDVYESFNLAEHTFIPDDNDHIMIKNVASLSDPNLMASTTTNAPNGTDITFDQKLEPKLNSPLNPAGDQDITLSIKELPLIDGSGQPTIDGTIIIKNPVAALDVKYENGSVERLNLNASMELQQTLKYDAPLKGVVDVSEKIPLGTILLPTGSSPFPNLKFEAYLKLDVNTKGEITYDIVTAEEVQFSLVKKSDDLVEIASIDTKMDSEMTNSGTITAELGVGEEFALQAFGIKGVELTGEGGVEFSAGYIDLTSEVFPNINCNRLDANTFIKANFNVSLGITDLYNKYFARDDMPLDQYNTCKQYNTLTIEPYPLKLLKGEEKEISVYHHYLDIENAEIKKVKLNLYDVSITAENDNEIIFNNGKISVSDEFKGNELPFTVRYRFEDSKGITHGLTEILRAEIEEEVRDESWQGKWTTNTQHTGGSLNISDTTDGQFFFELNVSSGGHSGVIKGKATIQNKTAVFQDERECSITFTKNENVISVKTNLCSGYGGAGITFDGDYEFGAGKQPELSLLKSGILSTKEQDEKFRALVGKDYDLFVQSMQLISNEKGVDEFGLNVKLVKQGFVRGLAGIMGAIIMFSHDGDFIYAAVIDGDKVSYYSNRIDYQNTLPKTIEKWVGDREVIVKSRSGARY